MNKKRGRNVREISKQLDNLPSRANGADLQLTKSQVETGLSKMRTDPEENKSLLSVDALQALAFEATTKEESLPATFLQTAAPHLHSTQGIVDFATTVCLSVARGEIKINQSAELRKWAELMYTCNLAGKPQSGSTQVNYVQQLLQLAGGAEAVKPEVVEVREAILDKKVVGE